MFNNGTRLVILLPLSLSLVTHIVGHFLLRRLDWLQVDIELLAELLSANVWVVVLLELSHEVNCADSVHFLISLLIVTLLRDLIVDFRRIKSWSRVLIGGQKLGIANHSVIVFLTNVVS